MHANLRDFKGAVAIVHHVQSADDYYFLELKGTDVRLGRMYSGKVELFDQGTMENIDWATVRLVSDGTHFRGYVGSKMIVHGHAKEPAPGVSGLRWEGAGELRIDRISVEQIQ